ncbi:MAG TPA: NAD-dependent malic enzyme [Bryobacteraceae bacterium]|nr:NAD-dependent malic enzyme [Bryobacteraceae bacterium]
MGPLPDALRGARLLSSPAWNKGTAFSDEERTRLGLHGLLPPYVETLEAQVARAYAAYRAYEKPLNRHIYLRQLQDNNEILFYRLLLDHIAEMMPVVYTPTVAEACRHFSQIYRRPRGVFISYPLRDRIPELLRNRPFPEVDVICVTDGERILGIGDQGVGGLGIPIGKLSLYSLIGGIHPTRTLPVVLDVGTNNEDVLRDPNYLGWHHQRIRGAEYDGFVDRFVHAVRQELPDACLQWEDFSQPHARAILDRYRSELLTFNDDIQGTGAVALGAILAAVKVTGRLMRDQNIVFLGAGSASIGVADYLLAAMIEDGLTDAEARAHFWIIDKDGLLVKSRAGLTPEQRLYERAEMTGDGTLGGVIGAVDATILIGLSTAGGAFTEPIVREMARKTERPIILPLSNPTERSEANPEDLIRWTGGRALIATGSPFAPVHYDGRTIATAQCNNVYIFPAMGLGAVAARPRRVTDSMFLAAARALAASSPALKDPSAPLLPALEDLRQVSRDIAFAVGRDALRSGYAPRWSPESLLQSVTATQWTPAYPRL